DRIGILDICSEQIDKLCSAANYMGYEQLTSFFEKWEKEVAAARIRLHDHEDSFLPIFITESMQANITATYSRFPRLISSEEKTVSGAPPEVPSPNAEVAPESIAETDLNSKAEQHPDEDCTDNSQLVISDLSMLPDFIIETREHLEEMEGNILSLCSNSDGQETLNDIFRSVHTIKGAAEYLGINRMAKLTHNLENLLFQLRQNKLTVNRDVTDLLMASWDRISMLTDNLEQDNIEQTEINDLLERIRVVDGSSTIKTTCTNTSDVTDSVVETTISPDTEDIEAELKAENTALLQGTDRRDSEPSVRRQADRINEKSFKQNIRVEASKIDALMNQVGELVVSRAGFTQLLNDMQSLQRELKQNSKLDIREMRQLSSMTFRLNEATSLFGKVTNELQEEVMKVRMLPISQLF
ncbi:MAG: Hpt domain-containing protein, partial [Deltaproteobacteria bacterium]|nr:Hpt domain-containing protein [Deltaproteobacteria bacterium]